MTFHSKKPPINILLTIDEYNKLLEFISMFEESSNEILKNKSINIKDILLKYSVPKIIDNDEFVNVGFFISTASDILYIFMKSIEIEPNTQYYTVLLKVREKLYVRKK